MGHGDGIPNSLALNHPLPLLKVEGEGSIKIWVDGRAVPLKPFVKQIIRGVVLTMISTLKGVEIHGDEAVQIQVKSSAGGSEGDLKPRPATA